VHAALVNWQNTSCSDGNGMLFVPINEKYVTFLVIVKVKLEHFSYLNALAK
jgi:hypothetical protein